MATATTVTTTTVATTTPTTSCSNLSGLAWNSFGPAPNCPQLLGAFIAVLLATPGSRPQPH
eukprot:14980817-Alexandrium_andersonii.AAC.1